MSATIRREGQIPEWKPGITPVRQVVYLNKKPLLITIYDTDSSVTIYIGSEKTYCIDAQIIKPSPGKDTTLGILTKIRFDETCALGSELFERGRDTTGILKLLLTYIHRNYPHVTRMLFSDMSMRICDNGQEVSLALMSYLTTGKTWYEKHFGAYREPYAEAIFRQWETHFQEIKRELSWGSMNDLISSPLPISEEDMRALYDAASTWQEFFGPLSERIGVRNFCIFIAPWIRAFVQRYLRDTFNSPNFVLPIIDYEIHYTVRGGGKKRRSRKRGSGGRRRKSHRR